MGAAITNRRRPLSVARGTTVTEQPKKQIDSAKASRPFDVSKGALRDLTQRDADKVFTTDAFDSAAQLAQKLCSCLDRGLCEDASDLGRRAAAYGANRFPERAQVSFVQLLGAAFDDFTIKILCASGALSIGLDQAFHAEENGWIEGAAILAAVAIVTLVTAGNDYSKEVQFRQLSELADAGEVTVVRHGKSREIDVRDLLVGDVLCFGAGDILPADGLIFSASDVKMDESHLTGESGSVAKDADSAPQALSGSKVLEGCGKLLVTAVGTESQQGIILASLTEGGSEDGAGLKQSTLLEDKLETLANQIGQFGLVAALITFASMAGQFSWQRLVVQGQPWDWSLLSTYLKYAITAITILVVAIPEGLPLAVTISLAYSVKRMLADNNLVRHLSAAETMGCATTICTDKTGTLTQNEMSVSRMWAAGVQQDDLGWLHSHAEPEGSQDLGLDAKVRDMLFHAIANNSSANIRTGDNGELTRVGNRTECALLQLVTDMGGDVEGLRGQQRTLKQHPFSSERKRMSTLVSLAPPGGNGKQGVALYSKGAAEIILPMCTAQYQADGSKSELSEEDREAVLGYVGIGGNRLLALAVREFPDASRAPSSAQEAEQQLTLLAVVGIQDPLRPDVPAAIAACKRASITVRMLTGDKASTAASIARSAGILRDEGSDEDRRQSNGHASASGRSGSMVMEGQDFRERVTREDGSLDLDSFWDLWPSLRVLARCNPTDKLLIVRALCDNPGEIVAMTGDGTNDAPALRTADVGFAMNAGTSVAKEASDILLLDNRFGSIVEAVKWGRNVYAGITKFLQFQLVVNIVAVATAVAGAVALQESPLSAVQMLWVNLIMDSLASLSLATEAPTDAMLDLPPYSPQQSLLTPTVLKGIVGQAAFQLAVMWVLVFQGAQLFHIPPASAATGASSLQNTIVFNAFVWMQLFNQVNARKIYGEWNVLGGILSNRLFLAILAAEAGLQVGIVQLGGDAFNVQPLDLKQWGACIGIGALSLLVRAAVTAVPFPSTISTLPPRELKQ